MRNVSWISVSTAWVAASACFPIHGQTLWDEGVKGDLSNTGEAPTSIINAGDMRLVGTMGNAGDGSGVDRDYFTFTVPAGARLDAIRINSGSFLSGGSSFIAVQAGSRVTATPTGGGFEALLGFTDFGGADIGVDILPRLIHASPELGGVLQSGAYSVWLQGHGDTTSYDITFRVSAVPELGTAWLLAAGTLALALRRRRPR